MKAKKILIVDDQKFALQLLRDVLAPQHFIIEEASDGQSAIDITLEFQPDIILLDLIMKGMDGVDTCRIIKQNPLTAAIPVIMITASKDRNRLLAAFAAGADDYLAKPFSDSELIFRIRANMFRENSRHLLEEKIRDSETLMKLSHTITSSLNTREILQNIVDTIANHMEVKRCSMARITEENGTCFVLASSDNPLIGNLQIDLARYPEIREVIRTGQSLVIKDAKNNPLMMDVREHISKLDFDTILVLPVIYQYEIIGTLILRTSRSKSHFSNRELRFCQLVADASATALKNAHLYERKVEESEELRQIKERLEELDSLKTDFINTATHELRLPVTIVHNYCSLIREMGTDNLTEQQLEFLNNALIGSEQMLDLVDNLLDLARLDSGKADMEFKKQNILEPVWEVYSVLSPFADQNGLRMRINSAIDEVPAYFDTEKIRCVLTNLVSNAIKFTPSGGTIDISVSASNNEVLVSVIDSGKGISEEHVGKVFEKFSPVSPPLHGHKRGNGLGLAICKKIVDAHSGKMWVNSIPTKGSMFTFSLPAAQ
jgi:signal transduction histidine kinase/DNA-binding response OmpR family regulator